uniref:NADH-ubiquinone oxidoreductase chain 1 n=3 Tax=Cressida cressida TaxID=95570 RepID=A0A5J6WDA1_9NEOP|nr:NADH dehydrogenase subunit 1 [Cressida cressida]
MMKYDMLMFFFSMVIMIIGILMSVAFLTLLERKILGYIQIRKGPNKVGLKGILQPFSDAIKLFSKEQMFLNYSNYIPYYYSPVMSFIISLMLWVLIPYYFNIISFNLGFLFLLCCLSLGVYMIMISGWSSNSNYSLLGGLRSIAQTISYEVSLVLIMLSGILMVMELNLMKFFLFQEMVWFFFCMIPLGMSWLTSSLAEVNRTPFDFVEGESELVSGFNLEYSSGSFALIFLAEYSMILFMSMLFILVYMGGYELKLFFYLKLLIISMFFIWVRGTLPRYRYDKLMYLCWKSYLPLSLNFLMFFIGLQIFIYL